MPRQSKIGQLKRQRDALANGLSEMEFRFESLIGLLAAIQQMSEAAADDANIYGVANVLVKVLVTNLKKVDTCSVLIFDPVDNLLKLTAAKSNVELFSDYRKRYNKTLTFKPGSGLAGKAFSDNRPYFSSAFESDVEIEVFPASHTPKSLACIPLVTKNKPIGILNISYDSPIRFDPSLKRNLILVAKVAANIIQSTNNNRIVGLQGENKQDLIISHKIRDKLFSENIFEDFIDRLTIISGFCESNKSKNTYNDHLEIQENIAKLSQYLISIFYSSSNESNEIVNIDLSSLVMESLSFISASKGYPIIPVNLTISSNPVIKGNRKNLSLSISKIIDHIFSGLSENGKMNISMRLEEEEVQLDIGFEIEAGENGECVFDNTLIQPNPIQRVELEKTARGCGGSFIYIIKKNGGVFRFFFGTENEKKRNNHDKDSDLTNLNGLRVVVTDNYTSTQKVLPDMLDQLGCTAQLLEDPLESLINGIIFESDIFIISSKYAENLSQLKLMFPEAGFILLSSKPELTEAGTYLEKGFNSALKKPYSLSDLQKSLIMALRAVS